MSLRNAAAVFEDEAWEYPVNHKHQQYISECMSFFHGRADLPYDRNKTFSKDELLELRPSDIKKFLCFKAYHDPNPGPTDYPVYARAESLKKAKSAISFFMVNKGVAWIDGVGGNPTRHPIVKAAIAKVEALETRGLGVPPNTKRAYRDAEFNMILSKFREWQDFDHMIKFPMMTLWAHHLIHRIDDTCHFKVNAPHGNVEFPFTIKTRTTWSKNVTSMKNCPDQIVMGSDDSKTCALLWLSLYLEQYLSMHPSAKFLFTTKTDEKKAPDSIKQQYRSRINKVVWQTEEFKALTDETGDEALQGVGTHSGRKRASTKAQRMGATSLQVEFRGRWVGEQGRRVVSRVYIDSDDTYTDAFVASLLCEGGAVKYELKDDFSTVTDNWLYVECVPNIRERYSQDPRFCRVMALCYLWAVFDQETSEFLCPIDVDRIRTNFQRLHGDVEGNPVAKIKLSIVKLNGSLDIIELSDGAPPNAGNQTVVAAAVPQAGNSNEVLGYMQRVERSITGELQAIRNEQASARRWMGEQIDKVIVNQRRFGGTIGQALNRQRQPATTGKQQSPRSNSESTEARATCCHSRKGVNTWWSCQSH